MAITGVSPYSAGNAENSGNGGSSNNGYNGASASIDEIERLRRENWELKLQLEEYKLRNEALVRERESSRGLDQEGNRPIAIRTLGAVTSDKIDALPYDVRMDLRARIRVLYETMFEDFARCNPARFSEMSNTYATKFSDLFARCGVEIPIPWEEQSHAQWNVHCMNPHLPIRNRCYADLMSTRYGGGERRVRDERATTVFLVGDYLGSFLR